MKNRLNLNRKQFKKNKLVQK